MEISIIESDIIWEDINQNLSNFGEKILSLSRKDLIILPEMFSTGFTMNTSLAEPINGRTFNWLKLISGLAKSVICGSYIVEENGKFYNRLIWMRPDGTFEYYDKKHLFTMSGEDVNYTSGDKKLIVELMGMKICPLICYDLRFPNWSMNKMIDGKYEYDILIYISSWPIKRIDTWNTLLPARAIENQSYVIGVNRIGIDGNDNSYCGDSAIYDFNGLKLNGLNMTIDVNKLKEYRNSFPVGMDWNK